MAIRNEVRLQGAPYWYGTPIEKLDFEWSPEEKLEIERYCEEILKNVEKEEMTPRARFEATLAGDSRDRLMLEAHYFNLFSLRTLDPDAGSLKPVDVCKNPKLLVKAHLATLARYALDLPALYPISYTDELWGGRAQMMEYGNPGMVGDPPIKSVHDLEGLEVPDPRSDGLFPGYLWAIQETKRIFIEYGIENVMPLWVSICVDPIGTVAMSMLGWSRFLRSLRNDMELCRRSLDLASSWVIRFGQAVIDSGADCLMTCAYPGVMPIKGNEWLLGYYTNIGKTLGPRAPLWYALTYEKAPTWFPVMLEKGAVGSGSFLGWFCAEIDYQKAIDFSRDHDLYCSCAISDRVLLNSPITTIEEEIKVRCEYGKSHSKFSIGIAAVDFTTPPANFEAAVAAAKKYGKLAS